MASAREARSQYLPKRRTARLAEDKVESSRTFTSTCAWGGRGRGGNSGSKDVGGRSAVLGSSRHRSTSCMIRCVGGGALTAVVSESS